MCVNWSAVFLKIKMKSLDFDSSRGFGSHDSFVIGRRDTIYQFSLAFIFQAKLNK